MIITNKFVLLNSSKTGSTFARKVLKILYGRRGVTISLEK